MAKSLLITNLIWSNFSSALSFAWCENKDSTSTSYFSLYPNICNDHSSWSNWHWQHLYNIYNRTVISIPTLFFQLNRLRYLESIPSSALSPIEGTNPKLWHSSLLCRALSSQRCGGLSVRATTKRMGGKLIPAGSRVISPCSAVEKRSHIHASLCSMKSAHILRLSAGLCEAKYVWKANRFLVLIWEAEPVWRSSMAVISIALLRNNILQRQFLLSQRNFMSIIIIWEINVTVALVPVQPFIEGKVSLDVEIGEFSVLNTALTKMINIYHCVVKIL